MLQKILPVALLICFLMAPLQAGQLQQHYMTIVPQAGCTPPAAITTIPSTIAAAYLYFVVDGVQAGDRFASNYYDPSGQFYPDTSGSFEPIFNAGNYCFVDLPFYIAGHKPGSIPGTWTVKVTYNGAPLFTLTFTITGPPPAGVTITSLSPNLATVGGAAFTMTVNGTNFVSGVTTQWNATPLITTYLSPKQLHVAVPANLIAAAGTASVTVSNLAGVASNAATFTIAAPLSAGGSIPHMAFGGGQWTTTITLINTGALPAEATLNFFDDSGKPLNVPVTFPQNSASPTTSATLTNTLEAGAGLIVETAGLNDPLATGWAQLLTNGSISGFAVFTDTVNSKQEQEALAPLENRNASAYLLWFDNTNGFSTAVALANVSNQAADITVILRDDTGTELSTQTVSIPAMGHKAFDLGSTFAGTANLRGSVEIDTPAGGQLSVLGLRFNPQSAFSALPTLVKAAPAQSHMRLQMLKP